MSSCIGLPDSGRNKVKEDLEFYSVLRSVRAIEQADVCVLMIDASGVEAQDMSIFNLIIKTVKVYCGK